tara:strand:- start:667 stop:1203 length:537 start_codon:yes stop_codon:yes gene_type:complete
MDKIRLRKPTDKDGAALHELVKECAPLDENSRYCNLLQVSHFGDTGIVAECADALVGFITGYRVPGRDGVLFVWQVGVSPAGRGHGLAVRMLNALVARLGDIDTVETTVTPDNHASTAMFEKFARLNGASISRETLFHKHEHFASRHEDEVLFRIGPLRMTHTQASSVEQDTTLVPAH